MRACTTEWRERSRKRVFKTLSMRDTKECAHPGWCFCVCVSQGLLHQSVSINSSSGAAPALQHVLYNLVEMLSESTSASAGRGLPFLTLQGSLSLSPSLFLSLSSSDMYQHTDYMLFFIIHAALLPLLESIWGKKTGTGREAWKSNCCRANSSSCCLITPHQDIKTGQDVIINCFFL